MGCRHMLYFERLAHTLLADQTKPSNPARPSFLKAEAFG